MWKLHVLFALAAAGIVTFGAGAFTAADLQPRDVNVAIVGDASAYLALGANGGSPHACFVTVESSGKASLSFGATGASCDANGGGTGVNEGLASDAGRATQYWFHDIMTVTNQGTKTVRVWVNASTTSAGSSGITLFRSSAEGVMSGASYTASDAGGTLLAPGDGLFLGVGLASGTLAAGNPVTGSISVEARVP